MKKRILRISGTALLLLALFSAYHLGLLHRAAFKIATATGIEWGESSPQTISLYFPRWACGGGMPPYLLVETDDAATSPMVGRHIRGGGLGYDDIGIDFGEHFFVVCRGRFKNTLAMLIWEHQMIHGEEGWCDEDFPATGGCFFQADSCEPVEPSPEQSFKIRELMKAYEDEPE